MTLPVEVPAGSAPGCADHVPAGLCVWHVGGGYVIVEKPCGLHSVPGRGPDKHDSIATRVAAAFPDASGPLIVHRLDLETSGLMVVALTKPAHRALSRQFMHRKTGKTYEAILEGIVDADEGAVDLPLAFDWPNRPRQKIDHERGRAARTLYRVLARDETTRTTRVQFRPITGRTHQLRLHAATPRADGGLGCPIRGDTLYGDVRGARRLMLHADHLAFWDPGTSDWVKFRSPAPF